MIDFREKALELVERVKNPPPVVGVLRLSGVIGSMGPTHRGLTMATLSDAIDHVFKLGRLKAVALAVNSPGGSPVQSALIARRIRTLADEKEVPVIAFAEDVAASGGYWLACAADEIFADENSIVGSIGVVSGGFGFNQVLKRLGIERRLHTAGGRKAMLDPFQREKAEDVEHLKEIQADIHESFKDLVRARRGAKLTAPEDDVFSGAFWTGRRALEMGLIDGFGHLHEVMRERYGEKVQLRVVEGRRPWWRRRLGLGLGLAVADPGDSVAAAVAAVEERLMWNRYGL